MRNCTDRGASLAELLMACAVSALLGVVVLSILLPGMRHSLSLRARAHLSQEAMLLLDRLQQDVLPCSRSTIAILPDSNGDLYLSLRQLHSVTGYRGQNWFSWIFYRWNSGRLYRLDGQSPPVVGLAPPNLAMLKEFYNKAPGKALGQHLKTVHFKLEPSSPLMLVQLTFEDLSQPNRPVQLQVERLLTPRNSLRSGI